MKTKILEMLNAIPKKKKYAIAGAMIVLVLVIIILLLVSGDSKDTAITIQSTLQDVLETSELSTVEYTYNSIANVKESEAEDAKIKYYVSYKGTVKAGFDITKLNITATDTVVTVSIPEITITHTAIEPDLKYIFVNNKYNTETVYSEAYNTCCDDILKKAQTNQSMQQMAIESAKETVTALTKPLLKDEMQLEVIYGEEDNQEVQ